MIPQARVGIPHWTTGSCGCGEVTLGGCDVAEDPLSSN